MVSTRDKFIQEKPFKILALALLSGTAMATFLYTLLGRSFIERIYNGESIGLLNTLISHPQTKPLSYYLSEGNKVLLMLWIVTALVGTFAFTLKYIPHRFRVLTLLLAADAVLLVPSILVGRIFDVSRDLGIPELFQYMKELATAFLLLGIYLKNRKIFFLNLSVFFAVTCVNDATEVNSLLTDWIADACNLTASLEAYGVSDAWSQLLTYALFGVVFVITYFSNSNKQYTRIFNRYAVLLFLLAFFGIILDGISETTEGDIFNTMENFGEMIAMSLLFAFTIDIRKSFPGSNNAT